jgi:metal-sulfur cluster biosynthetic enzyme
MSTVAEVLDALSHVRDPELDEPLTDLGFIAGVQVEGAWVEIRLRLPTYFGAPNFAWRMVDGARSAVLALPGVEAAVVQLEDNFAPAEFSGAARLEDAFPPELSGDMTESRNVFARKALVARQASLCDALLHSGLTADGLVQLRLSDVPAGPDLERCRELRVVLGIDASAAGPAFVLPDGRALDGAGLTRWLASRASSNSASRETPSR